MKVICNTNDAKILTDSEAGLLLPVRKVRSNKGNFGRVMLFAGCSEMPGAASLACSAAYVVGGGLVRACVIDDVAQVIFHWQREVTARILPDKNGMYCKEGIKTVADDLNKSNVILIGPGLGRSSDVTEFVREIIFLARVPLVMDADALFAVSQDLNILKELKAPCVITPHPGEMSRLTGASVEDILDNTAVTACRFSKEYNVVTLLKDAQTIIANPNGNFYINKTGNNALAKAGTGDVLAGMIAGFIAQGSDIFTASALSAYIHGKAGETASDDLSTYSVAASDLLKYIPKVIRKLDSVKAILPDS
jgi:NAD(P)H-hydrate epimerase